MTELGKTLRNLLDQRQWGFKLAENETGINQYTFRNIICGRSNKVRPETMELFKRNFPEVEWEKVADLSLYHRAAKNCKVCGKERDKGDSRAMCKPCRLEWRRANWAATHPVKPSEPRAPKKPRPSRAKPRSPKPPKPVFISAKKNNVGNAYHKPLPPPRPKETIVNPGIVARRYDWRGTPLGTAEAQEWPGWVRE